MSKGDVRINDTEYDLVPVGKVEELIARIAELEKACESCYDAQQRGADRIAELEAIVKIVEKLHDKWWLEKSRKDKWRAADELYDGLRGVEW